MKIVASIVAVLIAPALAYKGREEFLEVASRVSRHLQVPLQVSDPVAMCSASELEAAWNTYQQAKEQVNSGAASLIGPIPVNGQMLGTYATIMNPSSMDLNELLSEPEVTIDQETGSTMIGDFTLRMYPQIVVAGVCEGKTATRSAGSCYFYLPNGRRRLTFDSKGSKSSKSSKGDCFSGLSTVTVLDKGKVLMKDLQVGDKVLASYGKYQTVYSFLHQHDTKPTPYLQIYTSASPSKGPLEISANHLVFLNGRRTPVPAAHLKVGDKLATGHQDTLTVTKIENVVRDGLYAPVTTDGTLVVNGVLASSFVTFTDSDCIVEIGGFKFASFHRFSHMWEMPHRLYCFAFGTNGVCEEETRDENGYNAWSQLGISIFSTIQEQNLLMKLLLRAILMSFVGPIYVVGIMVTVPGAFAVVVAAVVSWRYLKNRFAKTASLKTVE